MNVGELIEQLQKYPADAAFEIEGCDCVDTCKRVYTFTEEQAKKFAKAGEPAIGTIIISSDYEGYY